MEDSEVQELKEVWAISGKL